MKGRRINTKYRGNSSADIASARKLVETDPIAALLADGLIVAIKRPHERVWRYVAVEYLPAILTIGEPLQLLAAPAIVEMARALREVIA